MKLDKKSWLIPWEILKKYLESHKNLFEKEIKKKDNHQK